MKFILHPSSFILSFALILICLPSCAGKVEIVNNKNPDGTFKPTSEVKNSEGESPDSYATLYHYPSNKFGVTAWYSGKLAGQSPKLTR